MFIVLALIVLGVFYALIVLVMFSAGYFLGFHVPSCSSSVTAAIQIDRWRVSDRIIRSNPLDVCDLRRLPITNPCCRFKADAVIHACYYCSAVTVMTLHFMRGHASSTCSPDPFPLVPAVIACLLAALFVHYEYVMVEVCTAHCR